MNSSVQYDYKKAVEESSTTALEFQKLYYETIDKKRHMMSRLYMDNAVLVWNGNVITDALNIQKFYEDFPTTTHVIQSIDAQPVNPTFVGEQRTFLVQTGGGVRATDKGNKNFTQSFVITQQGENWKIVSDVFRYQLVNRF